MNAVAKPRLQGQRTWTDAQRAQQAEKCRTRQIWLKSTGPKTLAGKTASSRNARHTDFEKRQAERAEYIQIRTYLRTQKSYTDLLKLFLKQEDSLNVAHYNAYIDELFFLENKLIDIERKMFGGMTFSEMMRSRNRHNRDNIVRLAKRGR